MLIITDHARQRIVERVKCRKEKVEKVAGKAFKSLEPIRESFLKKREFNGYKGVEYRLFQGCVFVFNIEENKAICITCLVYDKKN